MNNFRREIKWGVIFSLAMLGWMLLERLVGLHGPRIEHHAIYTNFFGFVAIIIYVLALREKREEDFGGYMSWTDGFLSGFMITVVVAVLSPLVQLVIHRVISPDFFENVTAYSLSAELLTQEEAETYFNLGNYMMQAFIGALLMGIVTAAVVALFLKKSPT